MSTVPRYKPSLIDESAPLAEQARQLRSQGLSIWPGTRGEDGWPHFPCLPHNGDDAWIQARRGISKNDENGFYAKDAIIFVASGLLNDREWFVFDNGSLTLHSRFKVEVQAPKERSIEFVPQRLPDTAPLKSRYADLKCTEIRLSEQQSRSSYKLGVASAVVQKHETLKERHLDLSAQIRAKQALAYIDETAPDTTSDSEQLVELEKQIAASKADARAASSAMRTLQVEASKFAKTLLDVRADISEVEARLLKAKRDLLFDALRRQLHDLHEAVAAVLAVEDHPSFPPYNRVPPKGWPFVEAMQSATPNESPFQPDWVLSARPRSFPGYSAAVDNLAAELDAMPVHEGIRDTSKLGESQ